MEDVSSFGREMIFHHRTGPFRRSVEGRLHEVTLRADENGYVLFRIFKGDIKTKQPASVDGLHSPLRMVKVCRLQVVGNFEVECMSYTEARSHFENAKNNTADPTLIEIANGLKHLSHALEEDIRTIAQDLRDLQNHLPGA